jgi:hypothetical protein
MGRKRRYPDFGAGGTSVLSAVSFPKTTATATVSKSVPLIAPQQSYAALATPKAAIVAPLAPPPQSFAQPAVPKAPIVAPLIPTPAYAAPATPKAPIVEPSFPTPAYAQPARQPEPPPRRYADIPKPSAPNIPAPSRAPAADDGPAYTGGGGYTPSQAPAYDTSLPIDDGRGYDGQVFAPPPPPPMVMTSAMVPIGKSPPVITPTDKPGIFVRIWRFFFCEPKAPAVATVHGDFGGDPSNTQQAAAASLVRRARAGDQNAMGTLNLIRENAAKGEPKAVTMYDLLCSHVRQNPTDGGVSSAVDKSYVAAIRLSHGEPLSNSRIQEYAATMSGEEERAFVDGMYQRPSFGSDPQLRRANFMGRTIGIARKLQEIRLPQSQIRNYDHACAWELGE